MKFRSSSISALMSCPRRFQYQYINGMESGNAATERGTLFHSLVESYFKGSSVTDTIEAYREKLVAHSIEGWEDIVAAFILYTETFDTSYEVIDSEKEWEVEVGGMEMEGRMDAILRNRELNTYHLLDLKTTSRTPSSAMLETYELSPQLHIYKEAASKLYEGVVWGATFLDFIIFQKSQIQVRREAINIYNSSETLKEILGVKELYSHYKEQDFFPRNGGYQCSFCSFRGICLTEPALRAQLIEAE